MPGQFGDRSAEEGGLYQLILAEPELIVAGGLWLETLLADEAALRRQSADTRSAIEFLTAGRHRQAVRPRLQLWEAALVQQTGNVANAKLAA